MAREQSRPHLTTDKEIAIPDAERQQYIATLRDFPDRLEARVRPLTADQLEQRTAPSEWCARQIVHHLADSHMSAVFRFKLPLTQAAPTLPTYDQDAWALLADYECCGGHSSIYWITQYAMHRHIAR